MVHDMINFIRPKVCTIGSGWLARAGALIFSGAELENRYCFPNARFLLHQPSDGIGRSGSDMEIQAEQKRHMQSQFDNLFAQATGRTIARIRADTQRNFWLNTTQARDYGLVGRVIASTSELS